MRRREVLALIAAAAFVTAQPAAARAPLAQVRELRAGTAIVQVDKRKTSLARVARIARLSGATSTHAYRVLPFVVIRGSEGALRKTAAARGVKAVHMDARLRYFLHESVPVAYGGQDPRQSTWPAGFDGRGVNVAVVDSGVDGLHPDLQNRMVANYKVVNDQVIACTGCNTDTTGGHGTHVAGIIAADGSASNGYYMGVAPRAGLVGFSAGELIVITDALGAFDYILANNSTLKIAAINNSWGPEGSDLRFDPTDPINVATKKLHDAGITIVFAAGNSGTGSRRDKGHEGASDCSLTDANNDGTPDGACQINPESVAPWVISVANEHKDYGTNGDQPLNYSSSRGDPFAEPSLPPTMTIDYKPTLSAPGTNIWSTRDEGGTLNAINCLSADAPSCVPPAGHPEYALRYLPLTGTSMAAPHVVGAVAVIQSYAKAKLGRLLTPDEVKRVLVSSATPMTKKDLLWDWPCGSAPIFVDCGVTTNDAPDLTGIQYQDWQVGAGGLNVTAALTQVDALPARRSSSARTKRSKSPSRTR